MTLASTTVHAGCVLRGEMGLLIQGPSGSGKSTLARALVERWRAQGRFACIVSDDRTRLSRKNARLIARPHPAIVGQMEVRGVGIVEELGEIAAIVRAQVEICGEPMPRMPESSRVEKLCFGVVLPSLLLDSRRSAVENAEIAEVWLRAAINS